MSDPVVQRKAEEFLQGQQLYYRSLKAHRDELKRYKESRAEHQAAVQLLSDLPDKTRHDIMVPLGPKAFMPGQLTHTNEVLVLLGENYFVERTAKQASGIIERRLGVIEELIRTTEKRAADLAARADLSDQANKAMGAAADAQQGGGQARGDGASSHEKPPAAAAASKGGQQPQQQAAAAAPAKAKRVQIQEDDGEDDDDNEEEDGEEEEEEELGAEFWAAAGFTGCWADDPRDRDEDDEDDGEGAGYADGLEGVVDITGTGRAGLGAFGSLNLGGGGGGGGGGGVDDDDDGMVFDDENEPVFEIVETEGGEGEGKLVEHSSQRAFEKGGSYPY